MCYHGGMRYYVAPLEGLTDHTFRRLHRRYFSGADRYYAPFFATTQNRVFSPKEFRDLLPENNVDVPLVPQLLGHNAEDFLWTAQQLRAQGYTEINLNLGCPSGTVTAKGKGAGQLRDPEALDRFLDAIFNGFDGRISVKTRLGMESPAEFARLLAIYERYPICELTIHPRTARELYRGSLHPEAFTEALAHGRLPLCYNGNITTVALGREAEARWPEATALMLGRGLIADPALIRKLQGGAGADAKTLRGFFAALYESYCTRFGSAHNAMSRMKGLWFYTIHLFDDTQRYARRIAKARYPSDYEALMQTIFDELPLRPDALDVP